MNGKQYNDSRYCANSNNSNNNSNSNSNSNSNGNNEGNHLFNYNSFHQDNSNGKKKKNAEGGGGDYKYWRVLKGKKPGIIMITTTVVIAISIILFSLTTFFRNNNNNNSIGSLVRHSSSSSSSLLLDNNNNNNNVDHTNAFVIGASSLENELSLSSSSSSNTKKKKKKKILVPIGDGSEEIETTCITDTLTRFGAEVILASVMSTSRNKQEQLVCKMRGGIKIVADMSIDDAAEQEWDLIVLPGGMPGATNLRDNATLSTLLQKQKQDGKKYAAICASPAVVLAAQGLIDNNTDDGGGGVTCNPAPQFRHMMTNPVNDLVAVTQHGQLTTSQGPGTAILFALELGEQLYGKEIRDRIQKEMIVA